VFVSSAPLDALEDAWQCSALDAPSCQGDGGGVVPSLCFAAVTASSPTVRVRVCRAEPAAATLHTRTRGVVASRPAATAAPPAVHSLVLDIDIRAA
jgi:hypothetical protein